MLISKVRYLKIKAFIYELDKGKCHLCGGKVKYDDAVLDHIIPISISGRGDIESSDEYWNLRLAHNSCNRKRGAAKEAGQLRLHITQG